MDMVIDWLRDSGANFLSGLVSTALTLVLAAAGFHYVVYRRVKDRVSASVTWYVIMLRTLEMRLTDLDRHLQEHSEWDARDQTLRRMLRKGLADVAAVEVAAGAVTGALDLPLTSSGQHMLVSKFEASRARMVSELQRAMQIVDAAFDLEELGADARYLQFLGGGPSPVTDGYYGRLALEERKSLRQLLDEHLEDTRKLACSYMDLNSEEGARLVAGETYWDNWEAWRPSRTKDLRRADS